MASITWTAVFALLLVELVVTIILVVPVPRRIRNWIARKFIFKFHLGEQFSKVVWLLAIGLVLALGESYHAVNHMLEKLEQQEEQDMTVGAHGHGHHHHQEKQKLYKAERNMYLAGFALTLLFVIARILQLMQESVELEEEVDFLKRVNDSSKTAGGTEGVEMTEMNKKKGPQDKKKD